MYLYGVDGLHIHCRISTSFPMLGPVLLMWLNDFGFFFGRLATDGIMESWMFHSSPGWAVGIMWRHGASSCYGEAAKCACGSGIGG